MPTPHTPTPSRSRRALRAAQWGTFIGALYLVSLACLGLALPTMGFERTLDGVVIIDRYRSPPFSAIVTHRGSHSVPSPLLLPSWARTNIAAPQTDQFAQYGDVGLGFTGVCFSYGFRADARAGAAQFSLDGGYWHGGGQGVNLMSGSRVRAFPLRIHWPALFLEFACAASLGSLIALGASGIRDISRAQRIRRGECPNCRYPAPANSAHCPECGEAVPGSDGSSPPRALPRAQKEEP